MSRHNNKLRFHLINVGHGDSMLLELPDYREGRRRKPWFGVIDAGGEVQSVKTKTTDYVQKFLRCRLGRAPSTAADTEDFVFAFVCLTHPHQDHCFGMLPLLKAFSAKSTPRRHRPREFWDCGFRYNTKDYLDLLSFLTRNKDIKMVRVASGTEMHFGDVEVMVLAPSIDMRNRYDTYGVGVNNASIVLRVSHKQGVAILAGDAEFDAWGKACEEFPRKKHIAYLPKDKRNPKHPELTWLSHENQLNCQLLKVAHHGSKNGTSYEYIGKLTPTNFAISCDTEQGYARRGSGWEGGFPHPITRMIIGEALGVSNATSNSVPAVEQLGETVGTTAHNGTMIYTLLGNRKVLREELGDLRDELVSEGRLRTALS